MYHKLNCIHSRNNRSTLEHTSVIKIFQKSFVYVSYGRILSEKLPGINTDISIRERQIEKDNLCKGLGSLINAR